MVRSDRLKITKSTLNGTRPRGIGCAKALRHCTLMLGHRRNNNKGLRNGAVKVERGHPAPLTVDEGLEPRLRHALRPGKVVGALSERHTADGLRRVELEAEPRAARLLALRRVGASPRASVGAAAREPLAIVHDAQIVVVVIKGADDALDVVPGRRPAAEQHIELANVPMVGERLCIGHAPVQRTHRAAVARRGRQTQRLLAIQWEQRLNRTIHRLMHAGRERIACSHEGKAPAWRRPHGSTVERVEARVRESDPTGPLSLAHDPSASVLRAVRWAMQERERLG
eukprot:5242799-Prymnesium_polylepis.1